MKSIPVTFAYIHITLTIGGAAFTLHSSSPQAQVVSLLPRSSSASCPLLFMTDFHDEEDFVTEDFGHDFLQNDDASSVEIQDLSWRVEKMRLEEQNKQRFLKARPRFLPYPDACNWVQGWGQRWLTAQDWQDWIMMGEKRNSYIPSRPDEYYTRTGEWISWDHFLGVNQTKYSN